MKYFTLKTEFERIKPYVLSSNWSKVIIQRTKFAMESGKEQNFQMKSY